MKFDLLPLDKLRKQFGAQKLILTDDFWMAMFNAVDEVNETPSAQADDVRRILEHHHLYVGDTEPVDLSLIGSGTMGFTLPDRTVLIVTRLPAPLIEEKRRRGKKKKW